MKQRLSFKFIFKLAFHGFFAHPVRLAVTLLLAVAAITVTGICVNIGTYNKQTAKISAYTSCDSFCLFSEDGFTQEEALSLGQTLSLPYGTIAYLNDELSVSDWVQSTDNVYELQSTYGVHLQTSVLLAGFFPEELLEAEGCSILCGCGNAQSGQIVISSCLANSLVYLGGAASYEELIGTTLAISGAEYIVCGVYNNGSCAMNKASLVGACSEDPSSPAGAIYFSESDFSALTSGASCVFFMGDHNKNTAETLITLLEDNENYATRLFSYIDAYDTNVAKIASAFALASVVAVLFSCLLLYQLISILTDEKRQTLGVLRSLGAGRKHCAAIILTECLAIGLFTGLMGAALSLALVPLGNAVFEAVCAVSIPIMRYAALPFLASFIIGAVMGVVSGILPVLFTVTKSPIDSLKTE